MADQVVWWGISNRLKGPLYTLYQEIHCIDSLGWVDLDHDASLEQSYKVVLFS